MTCEHCCGADHLFDLKTAKKELRKYLKKGPGSSTSRILKVLDSLDLKNKSLLDIGGGIGAIQWHGLESGIARTLDVDASTGYITIARSHAETKGWSEKAEFREGDFNDLADSIDQHDVVTLDKVVCCYPDYHLLLRNATGKTKKTLVLSFPMSNWVSKVLVEIGALYLKLRNNRFRPYIHPVAAIQTCIENQGFMKSKAVDSFPWHIHVYERKD